MLIQNDILIQEIEECIMCLEHFDDNDIDKKKLNFNHCTSVPIHFKCLRDWVYINKYSCIVCREEISGGPTYENLRQIQLSQLRLLNRDFHTYLNINTNNETTVCEKRIIIFLFLSFFAFIFLIFFF